MVLSVNEAKVLYGLVRWPQATDAEIGEKMQLNRTTVTVIRQRLKKEGYYRFVYAPDFRVIGCGIITVLYGEFLGAVKKGLDVLKESVKDGVSSFFYMVNHRGQHMSLGASQSLRKIMENIKTHHDIHHTEGYLTDKRHNYIFFPMELTQVPRYFDYAPLIAKENGIEHKPEKEEDNAVSWNPTKKEKAVFDALIQNPEEKDDKIAEKAGVSRQTVNTVRNKLLGDGVIKPKVIPDMKKLGFGILAFTHLHMNPHQDLEKRKPHTDKVLEDTAHILKICGELETVVLSVHKDFGDYKKSHDSMIGYYRQNRLLSDNPTAHIYPLE